MPRIETVFQSITTSGDKAHPKFLWPYTVKEVEGEKVLEGNQHWIKTGPTTADGIGGNINRGIEFAPDCKVAGFGAEDKLSEAETIAAMGMKPATLETCNGQKAHRYYKEQGSETPCPFCEHVKRERAEAVSVGAEADLEAAQERVKELEAAVTALEAERAEIEAGQAETEEDKPSEPEEDAPEEKTEPVAPAKTSPEEELLADESEPEAKKEKAVATA